MAQPKCYIFAGGGTGGHLMPGLAVAAELSRVEPDARVIFVGSSRSLERQVLSQPEALRFEHVILAAEPLATARRRPWRFVWRNWRSFREAQRLLRTKRPAVVIGLGGYASVPVVFAAQRLGLPTVLLEQNVVPGKATRWLSRRASRVCVSFEATSHRLSRTDNIVITGNPVRVEIASLHVSPALLWGESGGERAASPKTLLVLGGSQGASGINRAMLPAAEQLRSELAGWRIVHQTGAEQADEVRRQYAKLTVDHEVEPFFHDMATLYSTATLVVSRAGATTLAELACAGCPTILIPYPAATDNHQHLNADEFVAAGAARCVTQATDPADTASRLKADLRLLIGDADQRTVMRRAMSALARPDAALQVLAEIDSVRK